MQQYHIDDEFMQWFGVVKLQAITGTNVRNLQFMSSYDVITGQWLYSKGAIYYAQYTVYDFCAHKC